MQKKRVSDLARELNVSSRDVMKKLEEMGVFVPNTMSTLSPDEENKVRAAFGKPVRRRVVVKRKPQEGSREQKKAVPAPAVKEAVPDAGHQKAEPAADHDSEGQASKELKDHTVQTEEKTVQQPVKVVQEKPDPDLADQKQAEVSLAAEKPAEKQQAVQNEHPQPVKKTESKNKEKSSPETGKGQPAYEIVRRADGKLVRRIAVPKGETAQSVIARREAERQKNGDKEVEMTVVPNPARKSSGGRGRDDRKERTSSEGRRNDRTRSGEKGTERTGGADRQDRNSNRRQGQRPAEGRNERPGRNSAEKQGDAQRGTYRQNREGGTGRDNSRRRTGHDAAQQALSDIMQPASRQSSEKPAKKNQQNNRKDKRSQQSEDFQRKRNNARMEASMMDDDMLARHRKKPKPKNHPVSKTADEEDQIKVVSLPESMTVKEFADALGKPSTVIIKALMLKGIMAGLNQQIEFEQAEEIATDMDILVEHEVEEDIFAAYDNPVDDDEAVLVERPPVVVVMGHVDHGKTSLLDKIRSTKVTAGEAGGITQSIGASVVSINGRKITFLDTPGHEAFTAMRLRGAQSTDIAILVVAADDGVMPQTVEAISHAKTAGVQIIVAINKIDKPGANPDKVKQELTEYGLVAEDWGGSTICVPVSAKTGEGIDTLLEMVLLVADMEEYKANPDCAASGVVIEAELDRGRGAVATVLVQRGTLHMGDPIVAGSTYGRIKAMQDDNGKRIKSAGPSMPAEIIGLSEVPAPGEKFYITSSDRDARLLAEKVSARERRNMVEGNKRVSLEDLFGQIQEGEMKELNLVIKADTQGSVEAVRQSLEKISNSEVAVRCIHGGVGAINESDVTLAQAAGAIIIGFNVRPDNLAKEAAEQEKIDIRLYRVIYNAIDEIEAAMKGMLAPEYVEKIVGHAEVRQIFHASGVGTIAGSYVKDGRMVRSSQIRLLRDNVVIYEGTLDSLRRFKDDVKEVAAGYECGIMLNKYSDIKEGDMLEAFVMEEVKRDTI